MWFLVKNDLFPHKIVKVWTKFDFVCEIEILLKKHQICQTKQPYFPNFFLENWDFFHWSLNLIGILDFGMFCHLKAFFWGVLLPKKAKKIPLLFWPQLGQLLEICWAIWDFFHWSLNLIGILDFGTFCHLKAIFSSFMAQKRQQKKCHCCFGPKWVKFYEICWAITADGLEFSNSVKSIKFVVKSSFK